MQNLHLVYFSPTGTTRDVMRRIGTAMAAAVPGLTVQEHDCTLPTQRQHERRFTDADWVIFGMPVYYGRIPAPFHFKDGSADGFTQWKGNKTKAAHVVVYGDRAYEDALRELKELGEGNGFVSVAGAAFVVQHSLNPKLGAGRPHDEDTASQEDFGRSLARKMVELAGNTAPPLTVPGNSPYKDYGASPFIPVTDHALCTQCGICVACCPTQCIDADTIDTVRPQDCLCCRACIKYCPAESRVLPAPLAEQFEQRMGMLFKMVSESGKAPNKSEVFGL